MQGQTTAAPKKRKTEVSLLLEKERLEWLREMAHKHNLPDQGEQPAGVAYQQIAQWTTSKHQ
jgi:hypothetical protein